MPKLSDLADLEPPPVVKGPDCHIGVVAAKFDAEDLAVLGRWLTDDDFPAAWVSDQLHALGHRISADIVRKHRKGRCPACTSRGRTWGRTDG